MGMSSDTRKKPLVTATGEETFEAIFTRYYPLVFQLAYRCTGQRDEADDIAQEAFLRFYRTPPHATSEVERRAWLCRVTMNLGLNALRSRQRRIFHEERSSEGTWSPVSEDAAQFNPEQHVIDNEQA